MKHATLSLMIGALASPLSGQAGCEPEEDSRAFNRCRVCHAESPERPSLAGPNLWNVVNREAGTQDDYRYSQAVLDSGLTWDEATLRRYLVDPSGVIPGNRMSAPPIRDQALLDAVICHLNTLADESS
jgi:cytochrome c